MRRLFLSRLPENGSILIITLWAFITLSIFSLALASFVFGQIKFANFFMRSAASLPLAEAAVKKAIYERKNIEPGGFDTERALSAERKETLCAGANYRYYFIDEAARININTVSSDVLARLPGLDKDIAKAMVNSLRRPFKIQEEVLSVEGVTPEKFNQFKDIITIYGDGKVNINTAPAEALLALGLEPGTVDAIMRFRKEYQGDPEKEEDDGAFLDTGSIASNLSKFAALSAKEQQALIGMATKFSVQSSYLRLIVTPQIQGKDGTIYSIVIYPAAKKILRWQER